MRYCLRIWIVISVIVVSPSLSLAQESQKSSVSKKRPPRPEPSSRVENQQQDRPTPQEMLEGRRTPGSANRIKTPGVRRLWTPPVKVKKAPIEKRLYDGASLTAQQETRIAEINTSYTPRLAALARGSMRSKPSGPSQEAKALYDEYLVALDAVLTPQQRTIVEQNRRTIEAGAKEAALQRAIPTTRRPKDSLPPIPQRRIRR